MDIFCIRGGTPLHGRIALHGAKNAALPLLAATLATGARCELLAVSYTHLRAHET